MLLQGNIHWWQINYIYIYFRLKIIIIIKSYSPTVSQGWSLWTQKSVLKQMRRDQSGGKDHGWSFSPGHKLLMLLLFSRMLRSVKTKYSSTERASQLTGSPTSPAETHSYRWPWSVCWPYTDIILCCQGQNLEADHSTYLVTNTAVSKEAVSNIPLLILLGPRCWGLPNSSCCQWQKLSRDLCPWWLTHKFSWSDTKKSNLIYP